MSFEPGTVVILLSGCYDNHIFVLFPDDFILFSDGNVRASRIWTYTLQDQIELGNAIVYPPG